MSRTVTISDELADRLEERRAAEGLPTLDAAAETLIAHGLADFGDDDIGLSDDELRAAIEDGEASGPAAVWDAEAVKAEVRRRVTENP